MVLGSGFLARAFDLFKDDDSVLVFASGVSNSTTATEVDHTRERDLLMAQRDHRARLVYFSTCSLFDPALKDSGYVRHKLRMEELIKTRFQNHTILRLPNVVGHSSNPYTLCNHIRDRILSGEAITVQTKACRYFMDVDTVSAVCTPIIADEFFRGKTLNVCFDQPVPIPELVQVMERLLDKRAITRNVDAGSCYEVDNLEFKQYWLAHQSTPWPDADEWINILTRYYSGIRRA